MLVLKYEKNIKTGGIDDVLPINNKIYFGLCVGGIACAHDGDYALREQIILRLHFPFHRIGLTLA